MNDIMPFVIIVRQLTTIRFGYILFVFKSAVYALFIAAFVWKCKVNTAADQEYLACSFSLQKTVPI